MKAKPAYSMRLSQRGVWGVGERRMKECRNLIIGGISFVLVLNLFLFPVFHDEHAESDTFDDYKRCVGIAIMGHAAVTQSLSIMQSRLAINVQGIEHHELLRSIRDLARCNCGMKRRCHSRGCCSFVHNVYM